MSQLPPASQQPLSAEPSLVTAPVIREALEHAFADGPGSLVPDAAAGAEPDRQPTAKRPRR